MKKRYFIIQCIALLSISVANADVQQWQIEDGATYQCINDDDESLVDHHIFENNLWRIDGSDNYCAWSGEHQNKVSCKLSATQAVRNTYGKKWVTGDGNSIGFTNTTTSFYYDQQVGVFRVKENIQTFNASYHEQQEFMSTCKKVVEGKGAPIATQNIEDSGAIAEATLILK